MSPSSNAATRMKCIQSIAENMAIRAMAREIWAGLESVHEGVSPNNPRVVFRYDDISNPVFI
jgi:hypothetical protein